MGYDVVDKALVVNDTEATAIRAIFSEYLASACVRQLSIRLKEMNTVSRRWIDRHGHAKGGKSLSHGALYYMLRNPVCQCKAMGK